MATTEPGRTGSRLPWVLAAFLVGGLAVVALTLGGGATDIPPAPSPTPTPGGTGVARDGDPVSAANGPEGTRSFGDVPREIPSGVVLADATAVEGVVARSGDAWSASVSYTSPRPPDAVEAAIDAAVVEAGFASRERRTAEDRRLQVYDGDDGATLTVNLRAVEAGTDVAVVVVGP